MLLSYKHETNMSKHKWKERGKGSKVSNSSCSSWVIMMAMLRVYYDNNDGNDKGFLQSMKIT
jgi:hypothetical protein